MNEAPYSYTKILALLDTISGPTCAALTSATAILLYWPYKVGVNLDNFRSNYGEWLFAIMVICGCLVIAKVFKKVFSLLSINKTSQSFHFTPIDIHCYWAATEQKDGSIFTQIVADCNVLNLTSKSLSFHSAKLIKPRIPRNKLISSDISVFANSSKIDFIPPHETKKVRISVHARIKLGKDGKNLKASFDIVDRFGNKQRIKITLRDIHAKF